MSMHIQITDHLIRLLLNPLLGLVIAAFCLQAGARGAALLILVMYGPPRRVALLLLSLVKPGTQLRYARAREELDRYCSQLQVDFWTLTEEKQDYLLAELLLDGKDDDDGIHTVTKGTDLLAALRKETAGGLRYEAASAVLAGWHSLTPAHRAPPVPLELAFACATLLVADGYSDIAFVLVVCFCGLLRIGEGLSLTAAQVLVLAVHNSGAFVILILGVTKRGRPDSDKVLLTHPRVILGIELYLARRKATKGERLCRCSYNTDICWLDRAMVALGFTKRVTSVHTPSDEEVLQPWPFHVLPWASEASCRLYIMSDEVALWKMKQNISESTWQTIVMLSNVFDGVFELVPNG